MKPRSCGTCDVCCTAMQVPELRKDDHVRCEHLAQKGCGIYETRPQSCRAFRCVWLHEPGVIPGEYRPDRCGVMLVGIQPKPEMPKAIVAHETREGGFQGDGARLIQLLVPRIAVLQKDFKKNWRVTGPVEAVDIYEEYLKPLTKIPPHEDNR